MEKIKHYFRQSLARQFIGLMSLFIVVFLLGASIFLWKQQSITNTFEEKRQQLQEKARYAEQLDRAFTQAFFDARGYLAFGRKEFKQSIFEQKEQVIVTLQKLKQLAKNETDRQFLEDAATFTSYYFDDLVKKAIANFEAGNIKAVLQASENGGTASIQRFQKQMMEYHDSLAVQLENEYGQLKVVQTQLQLSFVLFMFFVLLVLMWIMRMMAKQIGKPLNAFARAADQFAQDETYNEWQFASVRQDEIGRLSRAFQKMIYSIREKEESLVAQNEELIAQQDELESQQAELEQALEAMQLREQELKRRNDFIKGLSSSLHKQEVLDSIVYNLCKVMDADRGIIVLLNEEKSYSAFGLSEQSVKQFLGNIDNGLLKRLLQTKQPFSVKREIEVSEKGYYEETIYSYDLLLPILSGEQEIEAMMMLSRFGGDFSPHEMEEYEQLSKQVAISLQKIRLYEESEKDRRMTQDILNNLQEGIQLVDIRGTILMVNTQLSHFWGIDASKMVQLPYEQWKEILLQKATDEKSLSQYLDSVLFHENNETKSFVYHVKGEKTVIQMYAEPLYRGGERFGTIFVHRDITKEFEVDQMKSEFVSTVSHELRTPLSSVLGFTELMLNKELKPERQRKYLTTIYQEAKRLTALINDFLDVQRMEAGRQTYDKKYEDIVPIIQNVIETQKVNTAIHQFVIEKETDQTIVLGDRDKLAQVFTNLLSNAVKYSPDGGKVTVRIYAKGDRLAIDVTDEGLGIPADALPHLFTKFYRVDNSDRRRIGGTGLGLAIVKEIVKAHDGEVTVTSEVKKGSTFTVSLPVVATLSSSIHSTSTNDENRMNVFIVEDDMNLASLLETELTDSGFCVHRFKTGREAVEAMKTMKPAAVVLDIMLEEEELSGWDVLKKMKTDKELANIPIVVSSALEEKEKGITLGASDYLIKPYQPSQLSKTILQILLKQERHGEILVPVTNEHECGKEKNE
ncbi:ATP-binding protein [Anoxybacteroides amylolyticum]|uniref:histidine kinase n=1 Tax=Anoxybacteroides amylolyticum TaxID=294699 RepID=A0A160F5T8_9BACL|nr:ATP-binding protein [Anoxybacillus amylolyticus]ANB61245.1 sensory box protein [Anoxybacillus amylolyticus]